MGADDCFCIRLYRCLHLLIRDPSLPVASQDRKLHAILPAFIERPQHGVVLQHCGNYMIPSGKQALQRDVQALCGVRRKYDPPRISRMKQTRQLFSGPIDDPGSVQRGDRRPSSRISHRIKGGHYSRPDFFRFMYRSCRIVHVDHSIFSASFRSSAGSPRLFPAGPFSAIVPLISV